MLVQVAVAQLIGEVSCIKALPGLRLATMQLRLRARTALCCKGITVPICMYLFTTMLNLACRLRKGYCSRGVMARLVVARYIQTPRRDSNSSKLAMLLRHRALAIKPKVQWIILTMRSGLSSTLPFKKVMTKRLPRGSRNPRTWAAHDLSEFMVQRLPNALAFWNLESETMIPT